MRSLVTGCNGFVGKYLCEHLSAEGEKVYGIDIQSGPRHEGFTYEKADIEDFNSLKNLLDSWNVDRIYHLAAVANPRTAHGDPMTAFRINTLGTVNLFEYCRTHESVKLLVVGSAEEYKQKSGKEIRYSEEDELVSHNIYGATKIASEVIGKEYVRQYGCNICFTRSFNHSGPGQADNYVLSEFAKQCADIKRGKRRPEVLVGNVDLSRDFLDVRDVVSAYEMIMSSGKSGEAYNVCSGNSYHLRTLLDYLVSLTEVKDVRIVTDERKIRDGETSIVYGSPEKIRKDTSWTTEYSIHDTLRDLFDYWLSKPD